MGRVIYRSGKLHGHSHMNGDAPEHAAGILRTYSPSPAGWPPKTRTGILTRDYDPQFCVRKTYLYWAVHDLVPRKTVWKWVAANNSRVEKREKKCTRGMTGSSYMRRVHRVRIYSKRPKIEQYSHALVLKTGFNVEIGHGPVTKNGNAFMLLNFNRFPRKIDTMWVRYVVKSPPWLFFFPMSHWGFCTEKMFQKFYRQ